MKKLKKTISTLCACALAATMGTVAFAAEQTTTEAGSAIITETETPDDLPIWLNATLESTDSYSVTLSWDSLSFTYKVDTKASWNPEDHTSTDAVGHWDNGDGDGTATIKAVNHSNVPVTIDGTYSTEQGYQNGDANPDTGVTVAFTTFSDTDLAAGNAENIQGVDDNGVNDNVATATVTVSGDPKQSLNNVKAALASVTITPGGDV